MTYGWAIVIIATVFGILVLIASPPVESLSFSSSDPTKMMVKGSAVENNTVTVLMQNITGGEINVRSVDLGGSFSYGSVTLNDEAIANSSDISPPITVAAGNELFLTGIGYTGSGNGTIDIDYRDFSNLERNIRISGSGTGGGGEISEICNNDSDDDGDSDIDCKDEDCDGINNCEYGTELTCNDSFDNDGDTYIDCDDEDCIGEYGCDGYY